MSKGIDEGKAETLLILFSSHFQHIGGRKTRSWKFKPAGEGREGFYIQCRNGTKNYIIPDSCQSLLDKWNEANPNLQIKELEEMEQELMKREGII